MNIQTLIKISRPRFWLYSAGTFLVGAVAAAASLNDLYNIQLILYFLYFIFPANLFIYGINDLYDGDTDKYNDKKLQQEHLLQSNESQSLRIIVFACLLLGAVTIWLAPNEVTQIFLLVFFVLAYFYSVPPIRFKARPVLDALSNVHYAFIGFAAYAFLTAAWPPLWAIIAALLWTAAMQIFSAIPDIASDKEAGLTTTAIWLGVKKSLLVCILLWLTCALVLVYFWDFSGKYLALIYPGLVLLQIVFKKTTNEVYWFYPYINALMGLLLTFFVGWNLFN